MITLIEMKVLPCQKNSNFLTRFIAFKFTSLLYNIVINIKSKYISKTFYNVGVARSRERVGQAIMLSKYLLLHNMIGRSLFDLITLHTDLGKTQMSRIKDKSFTESDLLKYDGNDTNSAEQI